MADNLLSPYSYPISEYTTDDEMRQERVSQALGWDTSRPWRELGMRALTQLPLAMGAAGAMMPRAGMPQPRAASQPRQPPRELTQSQRDLYELNPSRPIEFGPGAYSERRLMATPDPVRAERYWDALGEFRLGPNTPQSVPPSNAPQRGPTQAQRDFHEMPRPETTMDGMPPRPSDVARERQYWRGVNEFRDMTPPPRNRMNALLPFAGGAVAAPWLVPDEPY